MVLVEQPSLLQRADLTRPISSNIRKLSSLVEESELRIQVGEHEVFLRESCPPGNHFAKATVLLLHGQSYTSSCWLEGETMKIFAAHGYRCIAPDLPGSGQTRGPAVPQLDKPTFLLNLLDALNVKQVIVVSASMSAQFVLPLLAQNIFLCAVGIALSNTHEIGNPSAYKTPTLVLWGERDTSLGPTAAANLRCLPNVRLHKIESAGHACHLQNPLEFQQVSLNFFELIRSYHSTK